MAERAKWRQGSDRINCGHNMHCKITRIQEHTTQDCLKERGIGNRAERQPGVQGAKSEPTTLAMIICAQPTHPVGHQLEPCAATCIQAGHSPSGSALCLRANGLMWSARAKEAWWCAQLTLVQLENLAVPEQLLGWVLSAAEANPSNQPHRRRDASPVLPTHLYPAPP